MKRFLGVALVVIVLAAAVTAVFWPRKPAPVKHPPNNDPWKLVSYEPGNPYGTYLGNGFISTRIMGDGVGSRNGKPLPCYMSGLYVNEKMIPTPTWSDLRFRAGLTAADRFTLDETAPYRQTLDMRSGILTTSCTVRHEGTALTGSIEFIVSRARPHVALVRARFVPNRDCLVFVESPNHSDERWAAGDSEREPAQPDYDISTAVWRLKGSRLVFAAARGAVIEKRHKKAPEDTSDARYLDAVRAVSGKPFTVYVYSAVACGENADAARQKALGELRAAMRIGVGGYIAEHKAAWAKLWEKDIIIDGPAKDQQAVHSCMFYILQSVREGSDWSIPPMGLSNDLFSGHIFWDADLWIFPALILQHPELARSIVDYRYKTLPGALANAKASGRKGAEYAWESGASGREDTPPGLNYRHERHINGDVALAQWQYFLATGDVVWLKTRGYPVIKAAADYWLSRVTYNAAKKRYEILNVVPPDENAELVNNSVYTNAIARMNLEIAVRAARAVGAAPDARWSKVASSIYIPFDEKNRRFIAFDGYKGYPAKQADTELLIYPLQFKINRKDMTDIYRNTFDYYRPKVLANGPAMSASAHTVIAARLGDCADAYKYWRSSWTSFFRGPFNYFNEKRSKTWEAMCFLTGAAGPVQSLLFGIAGARMDYASPGAELAFSPCLPKQWKSVRVTGIRWRGASFDVTVLPGNKVKYENRTAPGGAAR